MTGEHEEQAPMAELVSYVPKTPAEAAKAIGQIAVTAISAIVAASGGGVSLTEGVSIAFLVVGLIPVYLLSGTVPKVIAAAIVAALQVITTLATNWSDLGSITGSEWTLVLLAVMNAIGIGVIPNAEWTGSSNKK